MVQLLADPGAFDGRVVRVVGFCHLEFEGNALYLHREDFEQGNLKNAVWLSFGLQKPKTEELAAKLNDRYIVVEATVDVRERGHLDAYSAVLKDISRAQPYPSRAELQHSVASPPPPSGRQR